MVVAVDRVELLRLVDEEEAVVVDVLPAREYARGHIPGAVSIPLRGLDASTASVLSPGKPVVVY